MKRVFLLLFACLFVGISFAQEPEKDRLDQSFGFREFKLKAKKEAFSQYELKKTDFYKLPEIIEVYEVPYDLAIGNTKMTKLHLFFLGGQLVRVSAILKDSLSITYLKKSFGEGSPPQVTVQLDKKLMEDIAKGIVPFAYIPVWAWKADTVRLEEKWLILCDNESCVKKMCLDLYLVDFQDLMKSILN